MKSIGLRNCLRHVGLPPKRRPPDKGRIPWYTGPTQSHRCHYASSSSCAQVPYQTRMNELHMLMLDERRYDALFIEHRCTKLELHEPMTSVFESENARLESSLFRLDYLAVHPAGKFAPNLEGKALIAPIRLKPPLLDGKISTTRSYQVLRSYKVPEHTSRSVQLQISDPFLKDLQNFEFITHGPLLGHRPSQSTRRLPQRLFFLRRSRLLLQSTYLLGSMVSRFIIDVDAFPAMAFSTGSMNSASSGLEI